MGQRSGIVDVANGVYSVVLGDTSAGSSQPAIDPAIFANQLWLGVEVDSDGEMAPRQKLTSVSYSIEAGNADTVDGLNASDFAPGEHEHDSTDITTGTLPVIHGGTGGTDAAGARINLGAAKSGANSDITSLSGLTTPLSVSQGGTGATNFTDALTNLNAAPEDHTHPADGDGSSTNELNTSIAMNGTVLEINDPGGTQSVDLAEKLDIGNMVGAENDGYNLFLGNGAGINNNGYNYNVGIGNGALGGNTFGYNNTAVGYYALITNVTGSHNSAYGVSSLYANYSGEYNTAAGIFSLSKNTTGSGNVAYGYYSLFENNVGTNNVGIGAYANQYNQGGSNNTIIGYMAGRGSSVHSTSGNVFIGYQAGYNETTGNKLYIDNSSTSSPLIYGDFTNDALAVNGTLDVATNATIGSTSVSSVRTLNVLGDADDSMVGSFQGFGHGRDLLCRVWGEQYYHCPDPG